WRSNDDKSQKLLQRGEDRAAEMLVALGPKGKRFPPLQGTGGFHDRRCGGDAVTRWLRGVVRFYLGKRCALLYPIALIYGTNTRSKRSMVRRACAFRSGK